MISGTISNSSKPFLISSSVTTDKSIVDTPRCKVLHNCEVKYVLFKIIELISWFTKKKKTFKENWMNTNHFLL